MYVVLPMCLAPASTDAQNSTLAPVLLAVGTDVGTEAERWSPLACPRSRAGGPRVEEGRQSSDSGQPPLRASEVRDVAGPSQAQSGGRRAAGPGRKPPAWPGRPARREPRRWDGPGAGPRAAALPGSPALWRAWPRHRPAESSLAERRRPGGVRDPLAGQGRGRPSAAAKFPGVACARAQDRRAGT